MSDVTPISIVVVLLVLSVFIIIANTFTVFVFWIHRHKLNRTFLIVFNLTVADLFVGLVETVIAGRKLNGSKFMERIPGSFLAMASGASVFFSCTRCTGERLRLDLAASTSSNKHQGLYLQRGYYTVSWIVSRCT